MPEVTITIGGRNFVVACQEGEEAFLETAAGMLDTEAQALSDQVGRVPEERMLLMAGLMLADRTASVVDRVREMESKLAESEAALEALRNAPEPEARQVEVPVVPVALTEALAETAARAEALAAQIGDKLSSERAAPSDQ